MIYTLSAVFVGMTFANFSYQWLRSRKWDVAAERSYFQGVALLAVGFFDWVEPVDVQAFVDALELPWLSPELSVRDLAVQAITAWQVRPLVQPAEPK